MNRMNRYIPRRTTRLQVQRVKEQQALFRHASSVDARRLAEKKDRPSPPLPKEPAA